MTTWTDLVAKAERGEQLSGDEVRKALAYADRALGEAAALARHHGDRELLDLAIDGRAIWRFIARVQSRVPHVAGKGGK